MVPSAEDVFKQVVWLLVPLGSLEWVVQETALKGLQRKFGVNPEASSHIREYVGTTTRKYEAAIVALAVRGEDSAPVRRRRSAHRVCYHMEVRYENCTGTIGRCSR